MIGELPGVSAGTPFPNRRAAHEAGVHRPLQAGICGTRQSGAESIVVSGGYTDDKDYGDIIIYTGHGGRDPESKKQVADQDITDSGNAALITSYLEGLPVRVLRGALSGSPHAPSDGYRYDGLYSVTRFGSVRGNEGFQVWQFRLEEINPARSDKRESGNALKAITGMESSRQIVTTQRVVRNTGAARQVKEWHRDCCQICETVLVVPGGSYSEGTHIQALGAPHDGEDVVGNILCLCANCHVLFDSGALVIRDDFVVTAGSREIGPLRQHERHRIGLEFIRSHRTRWRG